jgi:hypothetical protein
LPASGGVTVEPDTAVAGEGLVKIRSGCGTNDVRFTLAWTAWPASSVSWDVVRARQPEGNCSVLRRLLGSILIILGLAAAGLGVASATVWRESDSVVATATPRGDGTLVVTDPGVLELVGSDVTVVASVPGDGKVTVAVGRDIDVVGWVGIDHYTRVTGLTDWTTLATAAEEPEIPAPAEGAEAPTPGSEPTLRATTCGWRRRPTREASPCAGPTAPGVGPSSPPAWGRTRRRPPSNSPGRVPPPHRGCGRA